MKKLSIGAITGIAVGVGVAVGVALNDYAVGFGIGIALLYTSRIMYITLVYLTGAIPSEYYSAQKRPAYKVYQQSTIIFFPGFKK